MNTTPVAITVPEPDVRTVKLMLKGTNTLIHHRWDEKAIAMIEAKQAKKAQKKRPKRDPKQEFENSLYIYEKGKFSYPKTNGEYPINISFDGTIGMPATWIKNATVDAVRNVDGLTMTLVRGAVFIKANEDGLVPVKYEKLRMRRDMVRIGNGVADVRYRGELVGWSADVDVVYNADVMSLEQVINLIKIAGFACGIGEWRPQRNGDHGTFEVSASK
jgi:hypothetical protein